ncbi:MAG: cytochrome c [Bauldia sp.]
MRLVAGVTLAVSLVLVAGVALAQDDPVGARQKLMKMNNASIRAAFGLATGKAPYDAAKAGDAMKQIITDMDQFLTLFPEGSTGGQTEASPDVWTHMEDFEALALKLQTDALAAANIAPSGPDAFKAAVLAVNADCTACHQKYRVSE